MTGPIVFGVVSGFVSFASNWTVDRVPCTISPARSATAVRWSTFRPITGFVTTGLELRSSSRDETGLRSNRSASFAMKARTSSLSTFQRRRDRSGRQ
jgi:hypothetical protein